MKTQILNQAESLKSLESFFEEQNVNPYDYILIQEVTDDVEFQNELLKCLEKLRYFVKYRGFQDISELFSFRFAKDFLFTIYFEEDNHIYNCKFEIDHNFNDEKFVENKEILEMYIGTSLFGNEF